MKNPAEETNLFGQKLGTPMMGGTTQNQVRLQCRQLDIDCLDLCRRHHEIGSFKGDIIVYGGSTTNSEESGSFLVVSPRTGSVKSYSPKNEPLPPARTGHCATVVCINNQVLGTTPIDNTTLGLMVVGGWRGTRLKTEPNDVWFLDPVGLQWHRPASSGTVPGCANLGTLNCIGENEVALFLGGNGEIFLNTLYLYNLANGVWRIPQNQGSAPSARGGHSSTVAGDDKLVIFGGWDGVQTLKDCWIWSRASEQWTEVDMSLGPVVPGPRTDATLSLLGDKLILLGGRSMWKRASAEPLLIAPAGGILTSDRPALHWEEHAWQGSLRVGHRAAVAGSMVVVLGGFECKYEDDGKEELVPASTVQYILLDQQEGFAIEKNILLMRERIPEMSLFCCSECLSDVRFDIQGVVFPAHRLVLTLKSQVFRRMFTRGLNESKPITSFPLRGPPNTSPCVFEVFLFYLYTYDLSLAFLKQHHAPWSKCTDRDVFSKMIAHIFSSVQVDESLRHPADASEAVRVVIDPSFLVGSWPSNALPFVVQERKELLDVMLSLLQLADEYMIHPLLNICEIVIAHLVDEDSYMEVLQWAVAVNASSLVVFLEWMQRHPSSADRPIVVDHPKIVPNVVKRVIHASPAQEVDDAQEPHQMKLLDDEEYTIGFPTLADLPNVQSGYYVEQTQPEHNAKNAETPMFPIASVEQQVLPPAQSDTSISCKLNQIDVAAIPKLPTEDDITSQEPIFPDDIVEEDLNSTEAVSEPQFQNCEDPPFPGLDLKSSGLERQNSGDHSVRSSPVRTPTFDPSYVETTEGRLDEPADEFEEQRISPTRKLSQRISEKFRRHPRLNNGDLKSDKSFARRFRRRFRKSPMTDPSNATITADLTAGFVE
eukprot:Gregarina_sp_Poly_1__4636@NODE_247_length_10750_cov_169_692315_g217_i0_p1_GENE_NODE_247_length_10750_cov_169_692315_g217_i0NODE_247_length_10750_cov_169_692315_g217_i0_p1_ORF_typecomplete_len879_score99_02Kelch_3/PF13415_6/9_3e05Kelch_3/PF13415_6/0_00054Kelch_3/PF13415_6/1_4e07Kelch_3/PF13415_6/1_6e06Kelch_3/PF13415_6/1_2e03Kelch_6/PF13964_6/0_46Kelch_6/PF13964_6/0_018Kelch_6/PF13964_6/3_3Kelch_6/PF13964_6/1_6e06Kelch_6/PF13964_6/1e02Kelch_6/PF13964_6/1_3Kelch_4/PF13418_6/57Kelch_4/PF13418_6/0_1